MARLHVGTVPLALMAVSLVVRLGERSETPPTNAVFSIAIGFNGAPVGDDSVRPLQFADDDAASFHELARTLSERSYLMTVLDSESQRRFPELAGEALPPTLTELRRVVAELGAAVDAAHDRAPVVLIFYSGHGTGGGKTGTALNLLDGTLTRDVLYDQVLAPLHARFIHVFIDACHAEAVLRPRDRQAEIVVPTARDTAGIPRKGNHGAVSPRRRHRGEHGRRAGARMGRLRSGDLHARAAVGAARRRRRRRQWTHRVQRDRCLHHRGESGGDRPARAAADRGARAAARPTYHRSSIWPTYAGSRSCAGGRSRLARSRSRTPAAIGCSTCGRTRRCECCWQCPPAKPSI